MSIFRDIRSLSVGPIAAFVAQGVEGLRDRRSARREQAAFAPDPATTPEPVIQVYCARCLGWRRYFGVHTWIAVKPACARSYTVYEVTYWHLRRRGSAVAMRKRAPDQPWFGNVVELLAERRGDDVSVLIDRIEKSIREYPYAGQYVAWPGPNSNTFVAHIARSVPELELDLPPTAIGKDYLGRRWTSTAPSGNGFQLSLFGVFGVLVSRVEGFEVNVLGLTFGFDPFTLALKLPLIGRLGVLRSIGAENKAASAITSSRIGDEVVR
ncbi:MAG TPA: DUF3750 domain-containing protein [Burkholderiales bacterium]|jgi:hypothetical protein|nr:DUF3750 domain-containing protein [Burkholderiales bacterium]